MNVRSAVTKVNKRHMLLVFPVNNSKAIPSLWNEFFPKSKMLWEWDEGGDNRVSDLWHLREKISKSGLIVYGKWFRGRATLTSRELFPSLLKSLNPKLPQVEGLSFNAREILDLLEEDSPLSTKQLRRFTDLQGKENEPRYTRALKELWSRNLIVGFGEIDEGAFPSLAMGATKLIFEDLWNEALDLPVEEAHENVERLLGIDSPFYKFYLKQRAGFDRKEEKELEI
jgi:hypothetical protein